jgi:hypothetical protein
MDAARRTILSFVRHGVLNILCEACRQFVTLRSGLRTSLEMLAKDCAEQLAEDRWDGVSDLLEHLRGVSAEVPVRWEPLQLDHFAEGQAS